MGKVVICGINTATLPKFSEEELNLMRLRIKTRYVSQKAIEEMVKQKPEPIIENGLMKSGVVVRLLLLPMHLAEAKLNLKYLFERYGNSVYISLMNQYTPVVGMQTPLDRRVSVSEYSELVSYAEKIGVVNAFVQERESASESFIPPFDNTGVL